MRRPIVRITCVATFALGFITSLCTGVVSAEKALAQAPYLVSFVHTDSFSFVHSDPNESTTTIEVGKEVSLSWSLLYRSSLRRGLYDFVVFSMPNFVRVTGDALLVFPPGEPLPFGVQYDLSHFRIAFPCYLLSDPNTAQFALRIFKAGLFRINAAYVVMDDSGKIHAKTRPDNIYLSIKDSNPIITVQDFTRSITENYKRRFSHDGAFEIHISHFPRKKKTTFRDFSLRKFLIFSN